MRRALRDLGARTRVAGLRRDRSDSRAAVPVPGEAAGVRKLHPIADWTARDVHRCLRRHDLPHHPPWHSGYVSIGDTHSTVPPSPGPHEQDTRSFGLKRECGLHE